MNTQRRLLAGCLMGLVLAPGAARASQFTVNPTRVQLTTRVTNALVTVRNEGPSPIRLQVKTHAWTQRLDGQMQLAATDQLVVFPTLLSLGPGEQRRIRVAVTAPPGELERTYRVFLEELPAAAQAGVQTTGVQMLTRVGIPVFLQARVPTMRAGLSEIGLSQGTLHFQVDNLGNTHFVPDGIHVRGLSASGEAVVDKTTDGWYILGHGARRYELPIPSEDCERVRSILIEVKTGETPLQGRLDTPGGACGGP
jgi:fimbrial chaperone protein